MAIDMTAPRTITATRTPALWPLAFLVAAAAYPLVPPFLFQTLRSPAGSAGDLAMAAVGIATVLLFPVVGFLLLRSSAGADDALALRARAAGMLLIVAPTLWVMSGSVAAALGAGRNGGWKVWFAALAVGGLVMVWRGRSSSTFLSTSALRAARNTHRTLVALLVAFIVLHLTVNLTAFASIAAYNRAADLFRLVYRTSVAEPILLVLLATQLVTGLLMAVSLGTSRSSLEHLCQIAAGLVLATFLVSHTTAVVLLGRGLLNRGPSFTFASGGPMGVFGSAGAAGLAPYYTMGVIAVGVHLSRPFRLLLRRALSDSSARARALALAGLFVVVGAVILTALISPMR